jgi:acetyl esterase/lipase
MAYPWTVFVARFLLTSAVALALMVLGIVLPPPHRRLLPLAVGAPELSLWLALCGLGLALGALAISRRHGMQWTTITLAIAATAVAVVPLVQAPFAIRRFNARMEAALGPSSLDVKPGEMRRPPIVLWELLFGIRTGAARIVRGIPFAAPDGATLTLDVYRPIGPGRFPTVVQIYGGSWQRGEPGDNSTAATFLAAHGFVVFAIDYRHAPAARWPAQIEDVRTALAWIRVHAAEYDADPARLALLGRSAGAQLALVAAYEPSAPPIAAVVSLFGPVDLVDGYRHPPVPDPLDVRSIERAFLGGTPDEAAERYRSASPLSYVSRRLPPSLLIYGARDHVVLPRFGAALAERLHATGGTAVFLEIPWAEHAFDAVPNGLSGQLSLHYTERFLSWAFGRPAAISRP